jgi:hypothetical protein
MKSWRSFRNRLKNAPNNISGRFLPSFTPAKQFQHASIEHGRRKQVRAVSTQLVVQGAYLRFVFFRFRHLRKRLASALSRVLLRDFVRPSIS